jgi:hypothetical protein
MRPFPCSSMPLDPKVSTLLPSTTIALDGGTATYSGTIDANYVWTITSTGRAPSPSGGTPLTTTLHRTVTLQATNGSTVSAWSRFYQDDPNSCLTIDQVTIPGSVAAAGCLELKNGGKIANSGITDNPTSVDVGGNVTVDSSTFTDQGAATAGTGWTTSTNVATSNNAYATAVAPASSTSANLDATGLGMSIPSNSTVLGIDASVERHSSALATIGYDTASSTTAPSSGTTISWSHTVANQTNRVLVVGVTAQYTPSSCQPTTVTYGSQTMTKIAQSTNASNPVECASLWTSSRRTSARAR